MRCTQEDFHLIYLYLGIVPLSGHVQTGLYAMQGPAQAVIGSPDAGQEGSG